MSQLGTSSAPIETARFFSGLGYETPRKMNWDGPMDTAEAKRWHRRRLLYYAALVLLACPVAFYFGPNWFLFRKLTWITPADFAPVAQQECVPIVRAMKEYARDHGHLPATSDDLAPDYLPKDPTRQFAF